MSYKDKEMAAAGCKRLPSLPELGSGGSGNTKGDEEMQKT